MATPYTGDDTNNPTSITLPDDGDDADAASVGVGFEALADLCAYLLTGDTAFEGGKVFDDPCRFDDTLEVVGVLTCDEEVIADAFALSGTSTTRLQNGSPLFDPTYWDLSSTGSGTQCRTLAGNTGGAPDMYLHIPLTDVPQAAEVRALDIHVNPTNHPSALPEFPIAFELVGEALDGTLTVYETSVDTTAPFATYSAPHTWHITVSPAMVIDRSTKRYWLRVINENGTDSVDVGNLIGAVSALYDGGEAE